MAGITDRTAGGVPSWGAKLSYGERQSVDGVELLPVAFVAFGFGAGEGGTGLNAPSEGTGVSGAEVAGAHGEGGGGGGASIPLGAYIGGPDGLRFRPNPVVLLALGISVIGALGVSISAIIAATKRKR